MKWWLIIAIVLWAVPTSLGQHSIQSKPAWFAFERSESRDGTQSQTNFDLQLSKYIKMLDAKFGFRINERRAIHLMAQKTFRPPIVGGSGAQPGMLPWQVAILLRPYHWQNCGGAIIDRSWVLTAAHCVDHAPFNIPKRIAVFAGSINLLKGGRGFTVKKIIIHPSWNSKTNDNDIALLQLGTLANATDTIPLVGISDEDMLTAPGSRGLVSGWGQTSETGRTSQTLLFVDVPFVTRQVCNSPQSYNGAITDNMLCAGETGKDACAGDSGGPLVAPFSPSFQPSTAKLVGIVSFGEGCARSLKYGVYSRVRNYIEWIKATINANQ